MPPQSRLSCRRTDVGASKTTRSRSAPARSRSVSSETVPWKTRIVWQSTGRSIVRPSASAVPPAKSASENVPPTKSSSSGASAAGTASHSPRTAPSAPAAKRTRPAMRGASGRLEVFISKRRQPSASGSIPPAAPRLFQPGSNKVGRSVITGVARPPPKTGEAAAAFTAVPISEAGTPTAAAAADDSAVAAAQRTERRARKGRMVGGDGGLDGPDGPKR